MEYMNTQDDDFPSMLVVPFSQTIALVLLFVALLNAEHTLTLLMLTILGLAIGTKIWSRASLARISKEISVDISKLFPGDRFKLSILVQNKSWLPVWVRITGAADGLLLPVESDGSLVRESSLLWHQQVNFEWEIKATRRGVYQIGAANVRAGDLLGFYTKEQSLDDFQRIYVYPRLIPLASFQLSRRDVWGVPGTVHPLKDPVYLLGTRDYQHSQPAKFIHWKASARINRLQEKLFESTSQEKVLLLLDVTQFNKHQAEEAFEQTLEALASLGLQLVQKGQTVGFATNGKMFVGKSPVLPFANGRCQAQALLERLAQVTMDVSEGLNTIVARSVNLLWEAGCVFFSYGHDEATIVMKKMIQKNRLPTAYIVCQSNLDGGGASRTDVAEKTYRLEDLRL